MKQLDIYRKRGEYYLEPVNLDDLSVTLRDAVAAQPGIGRPLTVIFNGTSVRIVDGMDYSTAYSQWAEIREDLQAQSRRYPGGTDGFWNSLKAPEKKLDQEAMDYVAGDGLDIAIAGGLPGIVDWVRDYAGLYNCVAEKHGKRVQEKLEALGYQACENAAAPPQEKEQLGKYTVGRVLDTVTTDWIPPRAELNALSDAYDSIPDTKPINVMRPLSLKPKSAP
ncbi:MAG: hypothetical protein ACAH80_16175 [Alphaproteobacteria bacterium]